MKSSGEASDAHQTSILGNVGGERPAPDVGAHRGARCTQGRRGATEEEPIGGCVTACGGDIRHTVCASMK